MAAISDAGLTEFVTEKAETWLQRCHCPRDVEPGEQCDVHLVIRNCDTSGENVETEFERIQNRYRDPRFAADQGIKDLITMYRTPGRERASAGDCLAGLSEPTRHGCARDPS